MNSSRRNSSSNSHGQMGQSGVTSVWVGTRPSKDPPKPPTKGTNRSSLPKDTAGHWKTRRVSTGTGDGEYVVVSVRNSISEAVPSSRRNSTVLTPMSGSLSTNPSLSSAGQTITHSSDPVKPSSIPIQSSSSVTSKRAEKTSNCHANIGNGLESSGNLQPSIGKGPGITSNPLSTGKNVLGNINAFPSSMGRSGNTLASTGNGLGVTNNLLTGSNSLFPNINSLYGWGSFLPSAASCMPMMPLAGSNLSSLLFPQQCGLTPELLASSLHQTLSLSQASSLQNLTQPQTFPQTSSLLSLAQPLPASALDTLSTSLALNQALLSPDLQFLLLSTFFPTPTLPLTTVPGILPIQPSVPSVSQNFAYRRSPPTLLNQNPSKTYLARRGSLKVRKSSTDVEEFNPPLQKSSSVDQTDDQMRSEGGFSVPSTFSKAYLARRGSLKVRKSFADVEEFNPPLQKSSSLDQSDDQMTSEGGFSVPSTSRSSSISWPDSACDVRSLEDEDYTAGVTTEPCYDPPLDPQSCMRCGKKVYAMEKQVGPVRRVLYHKACFACSACRTALTLKNYFLNDADKDDLNVYCASHKPRVRHNPLDSDALLLQQAVLTLPAARQELCA